MTALRRAQESRQRAACLAACEFAVATTGISSSAVVQALQLLRVSQPISAGLKHDLGTLMQRLDEEYFDLKEAAEERNASESEWKRVFSQARAASALAFASNENAFEAATEAIYEATTAVDDREELVGIILNALDLSQADPGCSSTFNC
ncbi:MAG: hypothetical protein V4719_02095 [Planctomycetota bacterium]